MPDIRSDIYSTEPWGQSVSSSKPDGGEGIHEVPASIPHGPNKALPVHILDQNTPTRPLTTRIRIRVKDPVALGNILFKHYRMVRQRIASHGRAQHGPPANVTAADGGSGAPPGPPGVGAVRGALVIRVTTGRMWPPRVPRH